MLRKELQQIARKIASPKQRQTLVQGQNGFAKLGAQLQLSQNLQTLDADAFQTVAIERLLHHAFQWDPLHRLEQKRFEDFVESGRRALPGLCHQLSEHCREIAALREAVLGSQKRFKGMEAEVERIAPKNLLSHIGFAQLKHIPRYLRAIQVRAERAVMKPAKDAEKQAQLSVFTNWERHVPESEHAHFRCLLEELRVSIFAQELGTAESVSVQKLKALGSFPKG